MADQALNNYAYYGLVGQGITQAGASLVQGFGTQTSQQLMAGGYGMSAEAMDIQAEQELLNAEAGANVRMEQYNQSESANVAIMTAMGKTGENTTISDANRYAAEQDASLMRREGKMRNISARSGASSARSKAKQAEIAADAAMMNGIFGAVGSVAGAAGSYSMMK